ncbi:hypothetical protein LCGC14_2575020 [marine sediment metagenome]|uniref:Uncharacterized protein n=1 Tax=marine sediment metagenome TaxID=412755 RepID=A0A0F9CSB1_9ZZZZ|nr:hypothetical protein [bacterium]
MNFSKEEISLLAKAIEEPEHFKELIINNFSKFDWKLTEIDSDKCEAFDEFMGIVRNELGNKDLSTRAIMLEGVEFFKHRIEKITKEVLKETADLICSKIDESLGFTKKNDVEVKAKSMEEN